MKCYKDFNNLFSFCFYLIGGRYSLAKNSSSLYGASGSTNSTNLDLDDDDNDNDNDNDADFEQFANSTRRNLRQGRRKHAGPCQVTNPIDRCWRCQRNWAKNRKQLAKCALGFGRRTTGGMAGRIYVVTDSSDNNVMKPKPGTLRHAVIQKEPLWIIFSKNMNIKLSKELIMSSHKTIDGRGHHVHISYGAGITIQFIRNVIIHGIRIHHIIATSGGNIRDSVDHYGIRTNSDGDGISIFGSTDVWIDHVSMSRCTDGLIDAIMGSTAITISNCHFTHHNDVSYNIISYLKLKYNFSSYLLQRDDDLICIENCRPSCWEQVIATQAIILCKSRLHSTILARGLYRECQDADGVSSMLLTTTTLIGACMLLVAANILPLSARVTASSHHLRVI